MSSTRHPGRKPGLFVACGLAAALTLTSAPIGQAAPPRDPKPARTTAAFDYTKVKNLSSDSHEIETEAVEVPMSHDGVSLYVEVTRPTGEGSWPVILEASPYHGTLADRDGTRILPEPRDEQDTDGDQDTDEPLGLTRYFAPKGYAVVMVDLRGTGRSQGCLDHIGPKDLKDLHEIVEWAADQPWSNGRVGMTGHSYVGSTPSAAAATNPDGLATIVPSAGLATMYDHQFQLGVPYFLQWAGPMFAYEQLALERHLPGGDSEGKNTEDAGCGLASSSLTAGEAQASGQFTAWHTERDWRAEATAADIPVFMVHGVNDNAARVAGMEWFTERGARAGDKIWLGQWDHGSGCCPTRRGIQWTYALHAWFDKHLAGRRVDTGPAAEMFLSDGTFQGARSGDRSQILVDSQWPTSSEQTLTLYPSAEHRTLEPTAPALPGRASFSGDPSGFDDPQGTGGVNFWTAPVSEDTVLAGQPELDLVASVTAPRVHLIANLYDESPDGRRRRISQFALNPELRLDARTPKPVVPGELYEMQPPGFAMAHDLRAGHRLLLRITASDPDKVPTFAVDPQITVATGPNGTVLRVPVVSAPVLVDDVVPFGIGEQALVGDPQPTERASVTPPLSGPERVDGVTTAFHEFDVLAEFAEGNENLIVSSVPATPADIDLYLQRQNPDGTWSADVASGAIFSTREEALRLRRPEPGHYRVEVHNFLGAPATRVDLTVEFANSLGRTG